MTNHKPRSVLSRSEQPKRIFTKDNSNVPLGRKHAGRDVPINEIGFSGLRSSRAPALLVKHRRPQRPDGVTACTTFYVPPLDYLVRPEVVYWIAVHTRAFRAEIGQNPMKYKKLLPDMTLAHRGTLSRRKYLDVIANTLWLGPWHGYVRLLWRSGALYQLPENAIDAAFGNCHDARWLSKLEALETQPKIRAKAHLEERLRMCFLTLIANRPDWASGAPAPRPHIPGPLDSLIAQR